MAEFRLKLSLTCPHSRTRSARSLTSPERCSAGAKFYTRLQHACAVRTSRAISSAHRRDVVWVTSLRAESFSFAQPKIQAAGGESGAKLRSTSHVCHLETSLMLKNRTVTLFCVFSADVLAYRLTQNILQHVGWWRFEAAHVWCGACMMSFRCDVCSPDLGCAEPNRALALVRPLSQTAHHPSQELIVGLAPGLEPGTSHIHNWASLVMSSALTTELHGKTKLESRLTKSSCRSCFASMLPWPQSTGCISLKGSVSIAFVVWKYFSCIKKHLILCFDETKMDLKPLIMLLAYFVLTLTGYDGLTAVRKSDSTWRMWYNQTFRVYYSHRPISWLIPEMQYPVIYIIKFSNN